MWIRGCSRACLSQFELTWCGRRPWHGKITAPGEASIAFGGKDGPPFPVLETWAGAVTSPRGAVCKSPN